MATLNATNLKHASSGSNNIVLAADGSTTISNLSGGVGKILQVVTNIKKDVSSFATSGSFAASGMSVTITPQSASNKLLVMANLSIGNSANNSTQWKLYRGTSEITAANNTGVTNGSFLWIYTHSSSATYSMLIGSGVYEHDIQDTNSHEINLYVNSFDSTAYLNRRGYGTSYGGTSSLVVMEVAA
jgi:hypothetical protein